MNTLNLNKLINLSTARIIYNLITELIFYGHVMNVMFLAVDLQARI